MCSPAMATMGAQAFGGAMGAFGSLFGAKMEQDSLRGQARVAEINARIAEGNARNTIRAGVIEESRIKLRGAQAKGTQMAELGASGIDIAGSPTAQARLTGTDLITEVDANTLRSDALRAAWGQRIEAQNMRSAANSYRASAAGISPALAFGSSLINSVGQVASSWYSFNKEGAFDTRKTNTGQVSFAPTKEDAGYAVYADPTFNGWLRDPHGNRHMQPKMSAYGVGY